MITSKVLAKKVKEMREAQNEFFRTKQYSTLDRARSLEREVDRLIKEVLSYGEPVTGNLFNPKTK